MALSDAYSAGRGRPATAQMSLKRLREAGSISASAAISTSGIAVHARAYSAAFSPVPMIPNRNIKTFLQLRTRIHFDVEKTASQFVHCIEFRLQVRPPRNSIA